MVFEMNKPGQSPDRTAEALLFAVMIIWAVNYPVAKYAMGGINLYVFNSIRYVVAAGVLVAIFAARSAWYPVASKDWKALLQAGFVANVLYQMAFITGLNLTTAGNSAVLLSTAPLWTVYINSRMHSEPISKPMWTGMLVSLIGVVMIIIGSGKKLEFGSHELVGDFVSLGAAALWGLNTNLQKPLLTRYSATQLALVMILVGAVGLTLIGIPPMLTMHWGTVHWTFYLAAVGSGALSIGAANIVWSYGVKRLGPGRTANFSNLVPVLAFILSSMLLDEKVLIIQYFGAAVTIFGVWIARR